MPAINVLGAGGHLSLDWNPDDPTQVAAIRAEVERLRAAGYTFWLTEDVPADEGDAGGGHLIVRSATEMLVSQIDDPVSELSAVDETAPDEPRRRGRPRRAVTAVPRMAGGGG